MSATKLKIIAVVFMLIDHIGLFIPDMPIWFRWLGRLSAPLFLFCVVWGLYYTRNQKKYALRLYILAIAMELIKVFMENCRFVEYVYSSINNNFFRTLFLLAVVIIIMEETRGRLKIKLFYLGFFVLWQMVSSLFIIHIVPFNISATFVAAILGNCLSIEGGWSILLGLGMYFFKESRLRFCIYYITFCFLYFGQAIYNIIPRLFARISFGRNILGEGFKIFLEEIVGIGTRMYEGNAINFIFVYDYQWMMIFALPFMLLYNGKKGYGMKYFFYLFYPIHLCVLYYIGNYIYSLKM